MQNFRIFITLFQIIALLTCCFLTGCEFKYSIENNATDSTDSTVTSSSLLAGSIPARIMTYNIQYLSTDAKARGNRIEKLKGIIQDINPVVVAVQEVADRAAMDLVFPESDWLVVIDDDSRDKQDVAIAVKRPWKLDNSIAGDLDADDMNFLGEGRANESFFPNRRDALFVNVVTPDGRNAFTVVNIHAKARVGGRTKTDSRRAGASRVLVQKFTTELAGRNVVLMGDFNDSPDDVSLNILESGDRNAEAGHNDEDFAFMINLTQPLWEKNMVTEGASYHRYDSETGLLNIVYPESRIRNDRGRGRDSGTGPIMFDQILVSRNMINELKPASTRIYRKRVALEGPGFSRPSDHLPVYTDLIIQ